MKKFLIVFCIVAILTSCNNDKPIEGDLTTLTTVSGYLTNGTSPVPNATVNINDLAQYRVTSNTEGFFEIKNVAKGAHKLNYKVGSDAGSFSKITESIEVNDDLLLESLILPDPVILTDPEIQGGLDSNEVTLSWAKYTGTDFKEYKLYKHSSTGLDETTGELMHVATAANDTIFTTTLPYSSETYFRVFVLDDFGLLGGSNIIEVAIGSNAPEPEITAGVQTDYFISAGEEQEFYFDTIEAGFYSVAWFDHWFDDYDAGSIVVSAYNNDKSTYYFQNERLLQMNGSPFPIYIPSGERFNLSVKGYDKSTSGTYGIKITPLGDDLSTLLTLGIDEGFFLRKGEVTMAHFEAQANKDYQITVRKHSDGGSSAPATHLSIYEENSTSFEVYKESIPSGFFNPKTYTVSADANKQVYIVIDAAYWYTWDTVVLTVDEL